MTTRRNIQRGFSLVSAIFLLVVIAALGTFAVTLFTTQQQSSALDILGSRAYQASRAGVEWGAYQVLQNASGINAGGINCAVLPASAAVNSVTMASAATTLQDFTTAVSCNSAAVSEASTTVTLYQLTSIASQGAAATSTYVEREISVTIAR